MRFSTIVAALLPVGVAFAQTTHVVKVGGGALAYSPEQLTGVQNGDVIQFQFLDKNHTVTQSTFVNPCSNITDASGLVTGVDSGYQFVDPAATEFPVWQITINNASAPLWFYCRQAKHCQSGMVFAVNPTPEKTFDAFKAAAALSASVNGSPNGNTGSPSASGAPAAPSSGAPTSSAGSPAGSPAVSGSTPSPSASGAAAAGNGAGVVRLGAGATFMTLAGLSLGLFL